MMSIGEDPGKAAGDGDSICISIDRENNAMKLRLEGDWGSRDGGSCDCQRQKLAY